MGPRMQIIILYLSTAFVFLALDVVMLKTVLRPMFEARVGDWLLEDIRVGPAAVFYLLYIGGLIWFVSLPALSGGALLNAFVGGALLGALAYGTYEFTNYATLRLWSLEMVVIDVIWGSLLTGISAWAGVLITRTMT